MSKMHDGVDKPFDPRPDVALTKRLDDVASRLAGLATEMVAVSHLVNGLIATAEALDTTHRFRGEWTANTKDATEPPVGPLWMSEGAPGHRVWLIHYTGQRSQLDNAILARWWMPANVPMPGLGSLGETISEVASVAQSVADILKGETP